MLPLNEIKKKMPESLGVFSSSNSQLSISDKLALGAQTPIQLQTNVKGKKAMIPFALMTRKNNKTNVDKIELPSSSSIVVKARQRVQEEEFQRIEIKE